MNSLRFPEQVWLRGGSQGDKPRLPRTCKLVYTRETDSMALLYLGCGCLALRPALRPASQRRPLVMCENPVQDPADLKAALKELQPVLAAKQADGSAYLQQLMKLTPNREKNDELLEQVAACGVVGGGGG